MALINCAACGHRISSKARNCTKCGAANALRETAVEEAERRPQPAPPASPEHEIVQAAEPAQAPSAVPAPIFDVGSFSASPAAVAEPELAAVAEEWYYVSPAGRRGPVVLELLRELAAAGEIAPATLVWKSGLPDWIRFSSIEELPRETSPVEPQPTAGHGDVSAWALSLAPLWGTMIQIMATDSRIALTHEKLANYDEMWWIMAGLNVLAAYLDLLRFNKKGGEDERIKPWWCLAVPLYIYRRDRLTDAGMARLGVWIGSLLLALATFQFLNKIYAHQIVG